MKKISLTLSRNSLIYKSFIRPILYYIYVRYEKPLNESFKDKSEIVKYNAALVINGAIEGTMRDRIYRELGLEFLA